MTRSIVAFLALIAIACAKSTIAGKGPVTPGFPEGGAAGVCEEFGGDLVLVRLETDAPRPRCALVRGYQRLGVVNHLHRRVTVTLGELTLVVAAGEDASVDDGFDEYIELGTHLMTTDLYNGDTYSVEIRLGSGDR